MSTSTHDGGAAEPAGTAATTTAGRMNAAEIPVTVHQPAVTFTRHTDRHTEITVMEGALATDLAAALARLPEGAVLADFSSDTDVSLVFDSPTSGR